MDGDEGQNAATGIFLRFPTPTAQKRVVSAKITVTGGSSIRSRSCTNGASNFVLVASMKALKLAARTSSDGITLGMELKRMLSGFGSEPMKPSHSSVTTKVTRILLFFETIYTQTQCPAVIVVSVCHSQLRKIEAKAVYMAWDCEFLVLSEKIYLRNSANSFKAIPERKFSVYEESGMDRLTKNKW
ncbi:hypothetical protein CFP56_014671, partial [Quercus suber]